MPSLSTLLCMVSGPGALPLLRNLTNLISVWQHLPQARAHCPRQTCGYLGLEEDKNTYEFSSMNWLTSLK